MRLKIILLLVFLVLPLLFFGCKQKKVDEAERAEEMITARTLGLAYLEENELEKAEAEFLKLVDLDPTEIMGYANLGIVYLRMGKYREAENWLKKAIEIDPDDPDVRLILAKVYEMSDQLRKSVEELEKIIKASPGHVKSLYQLTELYTSLTDPNAVEIRRKYLNELVNHAPANIVPRLNLIESLIRNDQLDQALEHMEKLQQLFPEFPKESIEFHDKTITALQAGNADEAAVSFMIFHNYLKVTTPYQAGISELKGPGGSFIGFPVITFDQTKSETRITDWKTMLESIKFTDVTSSAGLDFLMTGGEIKRNIKKIQSQSHITACDYDGDGDIDLYAGRFDPRSQSYKHYLLQNEWGLFTDVSDAAGILHQGVEFAGKFADYDNDGHLDLFIIREGSNMLYKNTGQGTFVDVSNEAKVENSSRGNNVLFFDFDHDGDLDMFITRQGMNLLYRNNADGTFIEQAENAKLSGGNMFSTDAAFGDFDDDGDIDLFVVNHDSSNTLYSNQRQGIFKDITQESGLAGDEGSTAVTVGDYNNDGFMDLFIASYESGNSRLFRNRGDGSFEEDHTSEDLAETLQNVHLYSASFLDFDNDGFLDLLVTGESEKESDDGVFLYHNDGTGKLWVTEGILPEDLKSGSDILTFDYNDDGDIDVAITSLDGSIHLLRNDGGNINHYVKIKLVGLRTGSAKNNYYGIGAKVEIRSGALYQAKVVTRPDIHFGLGLRESAEVIRILWTNGVPQNIFYPGTDQDLVEEQILKGSCPFFYTWNGKEYIFVKDFMWKSALGMPLGIMGEGTAYAPPEASVDYIKIPGEFLKIKDNRYSIQVTCELWETIYMDKIELVVLDHPDSVEIFVDERMSPPSMSDYQIYQVTDKRLPVSAWNKDGINLLPLIAEKDDKYVSCFKLGEYQGFTEMTELVMNLGEIDPSDCLYLYLNGWIFPTDASINASVSQSSGLKTISPVIQSVDQEGEWKTIIDDLSFPMGKDKTIIADLTGKILVSDPRIRIITNMQIYWDHIFFTQGRTEAPVKSHTLTPVFADLHYRGFSGTYRKGGRYGPHWFDYNHVTTGQRWRDLLGNYTRYGDVLPLLMEADDKYIIKNAGDETTIEFSTEGLPELPGGWERDFLIHSIGWVKDGDLNTATGKTVLPLPFHGMTSYPYGAGESYPSDKEHREYLRKYNTRKVTAEEFQKALFKSDQP